MTPAASQSTARPPRPTLVNVAFWIYVVGVALQLVSIIVSFATFGATKADAEARLAQSGVSITAQQASTAITIGFVFGIIIALILLGLVLTFALLARRGAGWARIVLSILAVLSLLSVTGGYGLGAAIAAALIVASILSWLRPSNEWYAAVKAGRHS